MNHIRFDRLSRTVADTSRHSRRGVLAALGIAVLGALAEVDADAAGAKAKSRRRARHKSRHESRPRREATRDRLRASAHTSHDIRCKRFSTCQEAICTGESTLRPACTCAKRGNCVCPDEVACANLLVCQNGACLTKCGDDRDCANGATCDADGSCTVAPPGPTCDCSNLNYCSGNASRCTPECTCVCKEGWTGATCDKPVNLQTCSDHLTCLECANDVGDDCVFCDTTIDGATGICVKSDQCHIPQDSCFELE